MSLKAYDRLTAAQFSDTQARAILDAQGTDHLTRDYLESRLERLQRELFLSIIGVVTFPVSLATGVLLFALPKLITFPIPPTPPPVPGT